MSIRNYLVIGMGGFETETGFHKSIVAKTETSDYRVVFWCSVLFRQYEKRNSFSSRLIDLLANLPYIRDILKGSTKPNTASWSTWILINGIAIAAALSAGGALNTVILASSYFIGALTILVLGLFKGTRKYTAFDVFCQAIAVLGLVLWRLSHNPSIALIFVVSVDIFSVLPTIKHAYLYPNEETWITFQIASGGAFVSLLLATSLTVAALAVPMDFFLLNLFIASTILYRRRKMKLA